MPVESGTREEAADGRALAIAVSKRRSQLLDERDGREETHLKSQQKQLLRPKK